MAIVRTHPSRMGGIFSSVMVITTYGTYHVGYYWYQYPPILQSLIRPYNKAKKKRKKIFKVYTELFLRKYV